MNVSSVVEFQFYLMQLKTFRLLFSFGQQRLIGDWGLLEPWGPWGEINKVVYWHLKWSPTLSRHNTLQGSGGHIWTFNAAILYICIISSPDNIFHEQNSFSNTHYSAISFCCVPLFSVVSCWYCYIVNMDGRVQTQQFMFW